MFLAFSLYRGPQTIFNFWGERRFSEHFLYDNFIIIHTCEEVPRDKKPAKVLLFFDMTKYFGKKNQKKCIFA